MNKKRILLGLTFCALSTVGILFSKENPYCPRGRALTCFKHELRRFAMTPVDPEESADGVAEKVRNMMEKCRVAERDIKEIYIVAHATGTLLGVTTSKNEEIGHSKGNFLDFSQEKCSVYEKKPDKIRSEIVPCASSIYDPIMADEVRRKPSHKSSKLSV